MNNLCCTSWRQQEQKHFFFVISYSHKVPLPVSFVTPSPQLSVLKITTLLPELEGVNSLLPGSAESLLWLYTQNTAPTHLHPSSFTILSQPHAAATAHARFRPDRRNFMGTVCVKWNRKEEADGLSLNFKNPVIILKSSGKYTEYLFYVVL